METKQHLENHVLKPSMNLVESGVEYRLMAFMSELSLDAKIQEIENYMKNNDGRGRSEEEKDSIYETAKNLWRSFTTEFKEIAYTFYLNEKQFNYITNLLNNELEYDVNTVFFAIELTNLLGQWNDEGKPSTEEIKGYLADATETTYIYHLLAKHKIKGINDSTHRFSEILLKIGEISKIVSYYDTHAKRLSKEIQDWVAKFDESVLNTTLQDV